MTDNSKMNIYEILDRFNEEVDFEGLDNTGKTTDERDDVITRQTFNNWLREYNQTNTRQIRSRKIDQFHNEWYKKDIEKLIKSPRIQKRLRAAYLRATSPLFSGVANSKRVSKKYIESFFKGQSEALEEAMQFHINNLIDDIIKENFMLKLNDKSINVLDFIDKNKVIDEYIDMEKVVEEAFKIENGYYETPVYNDKGIIVDMKQWDEKPDTIYFLKNKE